jgi:diacylglycerol kinase family enzyme
MKVLCVLNPRAAGGTAMEIWPQTADLLNRLGVEPELLSIVDGPPLADQVSARLAKVGPMAYGVIAGLGGDGTHSGIINGLMQLKSTYPDSPIPPYAFIPLGTGNDIAKSLGIRIQDEFSSRDLRRAVSAIVHGADYELDLGLIDGLYFADAVTVGLDSTILRERNASKRRIESIPLLRSLVRGRFLYTVSLGRRFFRQELIQSKITVDGVPWYEGPMINLVVNNTRIYAGGFDFSEDAYADDGLLDVVLFTAHTDYLARYLLAMRHNPDRIRNLSDDLHRRSMHVQGKRFDIQLSRPEPTQVDGEESHDSAHLELSVVQRAFRIKIPAEPV